MHQRCQRRFKGLILSGPALRVRHQLFPWLRRLAGLGSILFPRPRLAHGRSEYLLIQWIDRHAES